MHGLMDSKLRPNILHSKMLIDRRFDNKKLSQKFTSRKLIKYTFSSPFTPTTKHLIVLFLFCLDRVSTNLVIFDIILWNELALE